MLRSLLVAVGLLSGLAIAASAADCKIMVTTWRGCKEACQGFQDYLIERGVDAEFILRDDGQDKNALPGILAEASIFSISASRRFCARIATS